MSSTSAVACSRTHSARRWRPTGAAARRCCAGLSRSRESTPAAPRLTSWVLGGVGSRKRPGLREPSAGRTIRRRGVVTAERPWARHYHETWQERAGDARLPFWLRVAALAYGSHTDNGHAQVQTRRDRAGPRPGRLRDRRTYGVRERAPRDRDRRRIWVARAVVLGLSGRSRARDQEGRARTQAGLPDPREAQAGGPGDALRASKPSLSAGFTGSNPSLSDGFSTPKPSLSDGFGAQTLLFSLPTTATTEDRDLEETA